jgi:hypothetical protein
VGELDDGQQADVLLASFDCANIVSVQASQLREFLLGKAALQSNWSETLSECDPGI